MTESHKPNEALPGGLPEQPQTEKNLLSDEERREPKFASAKNFAELYELIKKIGLIPGKSGKLRTPESLTKKIEVAREVAGAPPALEIVLREITNTYMLKNKVIELLGTDPLPKETK